MYLSTIPVPVKRKAVLPSLFPTFILSIGEPDDGEDEGDGWVLGLGEVLGLGVTIGDDEGAGDLAGTEVFRF